MRALQPSKSRQSESRHIVPQTVWLAGIGQQLRVEYAAVEQAEPIPERLAALINQLEAGEMHPEPAAASSANIDFVIREPVVSKSSRPAPKASEEQSGAGQHGREARLSPDIVARRRATALGSFEKLVLDLFDNHLREPEREAAVKKFAAYLRVCHAMLDLGLIKESELDGSSSRTPHLRVRNLRYAL